MVVLGELGRRQPRDFYARSIEREVATVRWKSWELGHGVLEVGRRLYAVGDPGSDRAGIMESFDKAE